LKYEGDSSDDEQLDDRHVEDLACALMKNDKFQGPVELDKNKLSDLAVLAISDVLRKPDF